MPERSIHLPLPTDLRSTLGPLRTGPADPTIRLAPEAAARALHTPDGAAGLVVRIAGDTAVAEAHGPGAAWALDHAGALLGVHDDLSGFVADHHPAVARAHHRRPGLRIGRSGLVADVLVPTILAQKVTAREAMRAWNRIVRWWGRPAPGPVALRLPPTCEELAGRPYWDYHRAGVERRRAETIQLACRRVDRLQEALAMPRAPAARRLCSLPGLGPWTAALVMRTAMGDPDAVEVGDYHVKNQVAWVLAGEARADDGRMLELLAPFAGHRGRVVRLLTSSGIRAPRFGPGLALRDVAAL